MSDSTTGGGARPNSDALAAIRKEREALERLAESDLRCARYAEALLDALDDHEQDRTDGSNGGAP